MVWDPNYKRWKAAQRSVDLEINQEADIMINWYSAIDYPPAVHEPAAPTPYAPCSDRLLVWVANGGANCDGAACLGWYIESADDTARWILDGFGSGNWKVTHWATVEKPCK